MIAVITGDIINSRNVPTERWQTPLKQFLSKTTAKKTNWTIYRGDSFQLEVNIEKAVEIALCIKALIKTNSQINVRMAIGIGEAGYKGKKVSESFGQAYINSGESFESLKQDTLSLKSPFEEFDEYLNGMLKLIAFIADNWKPATAEIIYYTLTHRNLLQKEVAQKLKRDSTTVNKALKRGAYPEILEIVNLYAKKIQQCTN